MTLSPAALRRTLPFVAFMLLLALRGVWPDTHPLGIEPRWLYGVSVVVVGGLLIYFWRDYGELNRQNWPNLRELALSVVVGLVVFGLWIHLDAPWLQIGEPAAVFVPLNGQGQHDWPLIVTRWVGATLVVPVMEELFWRSFLMRWIDSPQFETVDPRRVTFKAIVLSTFAFVLVHTLWLAAALAGLAYAWLYGRTGKLGCAVIAHAVTNGVLGVWVVATGHWAFW